MGKNNRVQKPATCHPDRMAHAFGLCPDCYMAEYRRKYPERYRDSQFRAAYGLSLYEYEQLLKRQDGKCAICKDATKLHVDHDHETDEVRGLLCIKCNPGLGFFDNDPEKLRAAVEYLEVWDIRGRRRKVA